MRARDRVLLRPHRGARRESRTRATSTSTGSATRTSTSTTRPTSTSATSACSPTSRRRCRTGRSTCSTSAAVGSASPATSTRSGPGPKNRVLEIDGELVKIAKRRARAGRVGRPRGSTSATRASRSATCRADSYDLVVGDAFAGESVPWHLTTAEVAEEIDRMLRPGGIVDDERDRRRPTAGSRAPSSRRWPSEFRHVAVIVPDGGVPEDTPGQPGARSRRRRRSRSFRLDPVDGVLLEGAEVDRYIGDAQVLTDDSRPGRPARPPDVSESDERPARARVHPLRPRSSTDLPADAGPRSRSSGARTSASRRC